MLTEIVQGIAIFVLFVWVAIACEATARFIIAVWGALIEWRDLHDRK